jgi:hypothetical protein
MNKKCLKTIASLLGCALLMPYCAVTAKDFNSEIKVVYNDISLYIDNEKITLTDANDNVVEPFIYDDTTYLPLRAVAETLLMDVGWDNENYVVTLVSGAEKKEQKDVQYTPFKGEKNININYRNISVLLNGEKIDLKSADGKEIEPFIYEGTTYLPLRAVAEATMVDVNWDAKTNSIYLTKPEEDIKTESTYDISAESDWTREQADDYGYTLDFESKEKEGYVKLTGYSGSEKDVLVPAKINGKPVFVEGTVAGVESKVFAKNSDIEYVTFEKNVILGAVNSLFLNCSNLKGIYNMPRGTSGLSCFQGCENLKYVQADFGGLSYFSNMFSNCKKIESVPEIGKGVVALSKAFSDCEKLSGDIYCKALNVTKADDIFSGTKEKINFHIPYPSTTYETVTAAGVPENVTIVKEENRIAYLPKEINVAAFTTLNLYNYEVAPKFADCEFKWKCDIGTAADGKFTISASEDMVGAYPVSVTISRNGEDLYTAESVINIVSTKNMSRSMSLVCIGDAYTMMKEWKTRVGRYTERIKFVGTRASSHEGRSGANTGYYLDSFTYTGDKNGIGTDNPFFNPETKKFDWKYYQRYSGLSPTGVQLYFQTHTGKTVNENISNMRTMVSEVKETAPDAKIFIVLPAYLASWNETVTDKNFEYICALDEEFSDDENIYFIPLNLTYDKNINAAKNKNYPDAEGYNQWGDCMYGAYAAALK